MCLEIDTHAVSSTPHTHVCVDVKRSRSFSKRQDFLIFATHAVCTGRTTSRSNATAPPLLLKDRFIQSFLMCPTHSCALAAHISTKHNNLCAQSRRPDLSQHTCVCAHSRNKLTSTDLAASVHHTHMCVRAAHGKRSYSL